MPKNLEQARKSAKKAVADLQTHLDKKEWRDYSDKKVTKLRGKVLSTAKEIDTVVKQINDTQKESAAIQGKLKSLNARVEHFVARISLQKSHLRASGGKDEIKAFERDAKIQLKEFEKEYKDLTAKSQKVEKKLNKLQAQEQKLDKKLVSHCKEIRSLLNSQLPRVIKSLLVKLNKLSEVVSSAVKELISKIKQFVKPADAVKKAEAKAFKAETKAEKAMQAARTARAEAVAASSKKSSPVPGGHQPTRTVSPEVARVQQRAVRHQLDSERQQRAPSAKTERVEQVTSFVRPKME